MSAFPFGGGSSANSAPNQVDVNQFPTRDSHLERVQNQTDCSICTEAFESDDSSNAARVLPCSHVFHHYCLSRWLEDHSNCPICRHQLPLADNYSEFNYPWDAYPNSIFSPIRGRSPIAGYYNRSRGYSRERSRSPSRSFSNSPSTSRSAMNERMETTSDSSDESDNESIANRTRSRTRSHSRGRQSSSESSHFDETTSGTENTEDSDESNDSYADEI